MKAVNIEWDTDGDMELAEELPSEIEIPAEYTECEIDYDEIGNYLSSQTEGASAHGQRPASHGGGERK